MGRSVPGSSHGHDVHRSNLESRDVHSLCECTREWVVGLLTVRQVCFPWLTPKSDMRLT